MKQWSSYSDFTDFEFKTFLLFLFFLLVAQTKFLLLSEFNNLLYPKQSYSTPIKSLFYILIALLRAC